MILLKRYMA